MSSIVRFIVPPMVSCSAASTSTALIPDVTIPARLMLNERIIHIHSRKHVVQKQILVSAVCHDLHCFIHAQRWFAVLGTRSTIQASTIDAVALGVFLFSQAYSLGSAVVAHAVPPESCVTYHKLLMRVRAPVARFITLPLSTTKTCPRLRQMKR